MVPVVIPFLHGTRQSCVHDYTQSEAREFRCRLDGEVSDNQYSAGAIISTVLFPSYFSLHFVALPRPSCPNDVSAVSEANGTTVPVSLDLGSSLSIQPSEGSRSRVRRTRVAMGIQSISA